MNEIDLINELNTRLAGKKYCKNINAHRIEIPTTLIVGCPRSGTTALLQYLASTGSWAYPSNLMTRFINSIDIGYLVQELLFHKDYGLVKDNHSLNYSSKYGRTVGALNINEFFHYWRRFFPNSDIRYLTSEELKLVRVEDYLNEITELNTLTKKPFIAKGLMHQFNLDHFYKIMPNTIFLYIKRNECSVMRSIYKARLSECGDLNKWWSAKPQEYDGLINNSPEVQIAGQVFYINKAISDGMQKVPTMNKLTVQYEDFVQHPEKVYESLFKLYKNHGVEITSLNNYPEFEIKNRSNVMIDDEIVNRMNEYYCQFQAK